MPSIPNKLYFRIGEVSDLVGVKPYVLRYWESEFPDIKPSKSKSGQRLYKRRDVEMLLRIKGLLYDERFTINGARKRLKDSLQLETQAELERLRQQLADSVDQAALDPGLGEQWFRSCSRRMNELREVERGLLQEMRQELVQRQAYAATGTLATSPSWMA